MLIVYDKSVDTEKKIKKSKWLIDTKIKIEATNLGELLKGDLSKAKLTDDSHLIYASQDLNKSDVEDINLKISNKDNHLKIADDAKDDTVVIPQETKITGTLEVEVGSNTSRKVNLGYYFKIDKTNTSLVAFGKTKNNPSVNIKDLVSVVEPSAYVPESLSNVNIELKNLLLVYDKSVSKPVNKVESTSESDVEAKGEKTTEKKWLIKGDVNLDSGDLGDIFDGKFNQDKVKMDCHFTYASQDFNKEDVESINKKITDESGKIKIPEKVKNKDKDKTENKKEENKDKKKEKDKKKDDIIIIHQGSNIFGTLELDIDSENGNTKKIELDYYYKKEKAGKSVIAVSKGEVEKKPIKVNLGALVKKIDDHADLANTLSEDTVTFEYFTLVYDKPTEDKNKSKWLIGGDIDLKASKINLKDILGDKFNKAEFDDNFLLLYASQDFTKKEVKNINSKLPEKSKAIAIGKNAKDDTVIISKGVYIYGTLKFDLSETKNVELDYSIKLEKEDKNLVAVSPHTLTVNLGTIIKNIDKDSPLVDKFSNEEIKLNYLLLTDDKPNQGKNKALIGGDLNIGIPDLSNLPLFGKIVKDVKLPIGTDLLLLYSTGTFNKAEVEKLNAKLPDKAYGIEIPKKAEDDTVVVKKGFNFFSKLNYADTPELKVADDKEKDKQKDNQELTNVPTLLLVENKIEEETSTSIPTKWLKVQKKIGPLEIDKIGIGFDVDNVAVVFLANGKLKVGGFSLALEGLSISEALKGGLPTVDLQGIAVDISKAGCFELAGAMVKYKDNKTNTTEYIGELKIQVGAGGETLEIMLLGAYSDFQNQASFFGYGFVGFPIPCPPRYHI